jgi:hypothetical protein
LLNEIGQFLLNPTIPTKFQMVMLVLRRPSTPDGPTGRLGGPEGSHICFYPLTSSYGSFLKKEKEKTHRGTMSL